MDYSRLTKRNRVLIVLIAGNFDLLSDKLKQDLKKVFEAEPAATEPRIYQGKYIHNITVMAVS